MHPIMGFETINPPSRRWFTFVCLIYCSTDDGILMNGPMAAFGKANLDNFQQRHGDACPWHGLFSRYRELLRPSNCRAGSLGSKVGCLSDVDLVMFGDIPSNYQRQV